MSENKLDRDRLIRLQRGELAPAEVRETIRDLLAAGGGTAADEPRGAWPFEATVKPDAATPSGWGAPPTAALEQHRLETEAERLPELFAELTRRPLAQQRLLVCKDARFQSWQLCEMLLERSWQAGFDDPMLALELAEIAVSVAYELHARSIPEMLLYDLKARAWSYLGNARRISSDLHGAEKAFELAESLVDRGSGDPLEQGRILELQASLDLDRRRLEKAERRLSQASVLYRRAEAFHRHGRTLISRGRICGRSERIDEAIELLREGLSLIDAEQERRMVLVGVHNLCFYLNERGDHEEALRLLGEARQLHRELANRLDLIRLRWLEGRIALGAGRLDDAEAALSEVRAQFVEQEIGYEAALVSLDLAGVYARQGRAQEMRRLAEEMIPIFRSRELSREVMAAWIVFQNAARMESASVGLIDELSSLLKASRSSEAPVPLGPTR